MDHQRTDTEDTLAPTASSLAPPLPLPIGILPPGISIDINVGLPSLPPYHEARTLVLCFDGTGDQFGLDNSNIVELFGMLKKDDSTKQKVYYQAGIGTYSDYKPTTRIGASISKALDEGFAWNLDIHVMDGYKFLMQNYTAGDRICLFGFSRGAYTARSLAGMIHKVGLLPADNWEQIPFAYKMYTQTDEVGWKQSNAFKKTFSNDVDIEFVGVWDTVNSVGLFPRRLPFTTSNTIVRTFRHAVSLDERRAKFKANLWNRPTDEEHLLSISDQKIEETKILMAAASQEVREAVKSATSPTIQAQAATKALAPYFASLYGTAPAPASVAAKPTPGSSTPSSSTLKKNPGKTQSQIAKQHDEEEQQLETMEKKYGGNRSAPTDIEEVWFSGCHCDVGGGSVANETPFTLARIALRWMIRECFKTNSGIMFDPEGLRRIGLTPSHLWPKVQPRPPALDGSASILQAIPKDSTIFDPVKVKQCLPTFTGDLSATSASDVKFTEEELDLLDGMAPIYDQLSLAKGWWTLEVLPMHYRYQKSDGTWVTELKMNWGQGRYIPSQKTNKVRVHRSVKARFDAKFADGKSYVTPSNLDLANVIWVE